MKKFVLSCMTLLAMGATAFADEIVSYEPDEEFATIADGDIFAIYNKADEKFLYGAGAQNLGYDVADKAFVSTNSGWMFKAESIDVGGNTYYLLRLMTPTGGEYSVWGNPGYLNSQTATGWCSFILGLVGDNKDHTYGQDFDYGAAWDIEETDEGFKLKNVGTGLYLNNAGTANNENAVVWTFCTLKETKVENPIEKGTYDATDANTALFENFTTLADGATYDAETKIFTGNCGWQWAEGADFGAYQYIVITVAQNVLNKGCKVHIKDATGFEVSGDDYGADYMNMWIGAWNNHNCLKIDLEKLRSEKKFDIHHVAEILIEAGDGLILGNAYATNQVPENNKNWNGEETGDFKVTITNNTYATICVPFEASVAGAYVFEIAGKNKDGIELKMYNGILEAGKPYFFLSNENESGNVYFYKATATTADEAGENNGLIGTFEALEGDYVVLGEGVLTQGTAVAANQAYIDLDKIEGEATLATLLFDDALNKTVGIETIEVAPAAQVVYNLAGQRVAKAQKGLFVINGKKVVVK